jgi:hypothetical protein
MKINTPGCYEMSSERYHADPCETPSLSAGMINDILVAPAKCFQNSKRLNPEWSEPGGEDRFTIGAVAHVLFLEPDQFAAKVKIIEHDDYRTGAAKLARDTARASGKTPILMKQMDQIIAAQSAFTSHQFAANAFQGGKTEQSLFWKHAGTGIWCRARPDFIHDSGAHINDYKTTSNANPQFFGKHAYDLGYHRRAAWYLEGYEAVFGKRPDHYWFINQEIKAPYLVSVCELTLQAIQSGQEENDRAAERFARCLERRDWPGYRHPDKPDHDLAFQCDIPSWAYAQIDERL